MNVQLLTKSSSQMVLQNLKSNSVNILLIKNVKTVQFIYVNQALKLIIVPMKIPRTFTIHLIGLFMMLKKEMVNKLSFKFKLVAAFFINSLVQKVIVNIPLPCKFFIIIERNIMEHVNRVDQTMYKSFSWQSDSFAICLYNNNNNFYVKIPRVKLLKVKLKRYIINKNILNSLFLIWFVLQDNF